MKPESVSKSLRIGFGPYTDASSGWSKLASVDATSARCSDQTAESLKNYTTPLTPADAADNCDPYCALAGRPTRN